MTLFSADPRRLGYSCDDLDAPVHDRLTGECYRNACEAEDAGVAWRYGCAASSKAPAAAEPEGWGPGRPPAVMYMPGDGPPDEGGLPVDESSLWHRRRGSPGGGSPGGGYSAPARTIGGGLRLGPSALNAAGGRTIGGGLRSGPGPLRPAGSGMSLQPAPGPFSTAGGHTLMTGPGDTLATAASHQHTLMTGPSGTLARTMFSASRPAQHAVTAMRPAGFVAKPTPMTARSLRGLGQTTTVGLAGLGTIAGLWALALFLANQNRRAAE